MYPPETGILAEMEKYAYENDVPIIRPAARRYLRWFLPTIRPRSIIELGTAIGFSAILMAEAALDARIITIENYEPRIPIARENIKKAGISDRVQMIEGDAAEILKSISQKPQPADAKPDISTDIADMSFDFAFIDAAKAQYETYLELILPFMHSGSVIVFDNVLAQDSGSTLDSRYAIERRDRTIHARMRKLLHSVTRDRRFVTDLSPVGDGILTITLT